jgi:hypothetical protein
MSRLMQGFYHWTHKEVLDYWNWGCRMHNSMDEEGWVVAVQHLSQRLGTQ